MTPGPTDSTSPVDFFSQKPGATPFTHLALMPCNVSVPLTLCVCVDGTVWAKREADSSSNEHSFRILMGICTRLRSGRTRRHLGKRWSRPSPCFAGESIRQQLL